ncbi:MAG: MarR family winged helix-turn-helix transcriptional regulator [Acidiferrobacterales bacterium]
MSDPAKVSERAVAELVAQLGRMAYGDGFVEGLTPAQWTALRYFSRANRFSRSVSAFAEFHATTRGTASQTVKSLVRDGYLTRERLDKDRRSVRHDLTDKSVGLLSHDPFEGLVSAAGELSNTARRAMSRGLGKMLRVLAKRHGKREFGICPSCKYLRSGGCLVGNAPDYRCALFDEPLTETDIEELCVNFIPAR